MSKILISHEIPKTLFPIHDFINNYPYVLAHLLMEETEHYDKEYAEFYKNKLAKCDYSILDNSLYELGDSIDYKRLYELGEEYKPSHIILPDCLNDVVETKKRAQNYIKEFGDKSTPKFMGVIHGKSYDELRDILYYMITNPAIDIIAVPFSIMEKTIPPSANQKLWRVNVIRELIYPILKGLKSQKKLHLLGCHTPLEFSCYLPLEKEYIYSVDTSAPIVYGWSGIDFTNLSFDANKPKDKLAENLDIELTQDNLDLIAKNVNYFRTQL